MFCFNSGTCNSDKTDFFQKNISAAPAHHFIVIIHSSTSNNVNVCIWYSKCGVQNNSSNLLPLHTHQLLQPQSYFHYTTKVTLRLLKETHSWRKHMCLKVKSSEAHERRSSIQLSVCCAIEPKNCQFCIGAWLVLHVALYPIVATCFLLHFCGVFCLFAPNALLTLFGPLLMTELQHRHSCANFVHANIYYVHTYICVYW